MVEESDICVICQEDLTSGPVFEIPECKHSFHQGCINAWFRQGNTKCPLCNSCGQGGETDRHCGRGWGMSQFTSLRRASRRKDAPVQLVKGMGRVKKKEVALAELKKELKSWQDKEITLDGETMKVKEAVKKYKKISRSYRTKLWQLRRYKVKFAQQQNIVPIILVERRVVD